MSKVDGPGFRWAIQKRPRKVCGWRLEADSWLHQIFLDRLEQNRDLAGENVDFSHYWMAMRVRQMVSILTLPSTTALDKRLWELSDVWINVKARGQAEVYECQINDFPAELWRQPKERIYWPDTSDHPEMQALDRMKEEKIERGLTEVEEDDEEVDPDEVRREEKIAIAQSLRSSEHVELTGEEIGEIVDRSDTWVYNNTEAAK